MAENKIYREQYSILVVDDTLMYRKICEGILKKNGYVVKSVESGEDAIKLLKDYTPDLILLDIVMSGISGYDTLKILRVNKSTQNIPVVFLTAEIGEEKEIEGFRLGAADYITKPFVEEVMLKRIERVIQLDVLQKDLAKQVEIKGKQLEKLSLQTMLTIAATVDAKDRYTGGHSVRVAKYSMQIAKRLGWSEKKRRNLYYTALLHDIGKIGVSDIVLNKPTELTYVEYDEIKIHTTIGGEILKALTVINGISDGAKYHHERYDGKGYPSGLVGRKIPLNARIICVADAYDAMSSRRIYRNALDKGKIIVELENGKGSQFDPMLIDIMVSIIRAGFVATDEHDIAIEKGNLASESNAILHNLYRQSLREHKKQMGIDPLTQLYNRKVLESEANRILAVEKQEGTLLMMDVDNYKQVNDNYGHLVGDKILQILAEILHTHVGANDIVGRIGGDEFVVFLKGAIPQNTVRALIQQITEDFANEKKDVDSHNYTSLSIGVASTEGRRTDYSFQRLYRQADKALYYSKHQGKNKYFFYNKLLADSIKNIGDKNEEQVSALKSYLEKRLNGDMVTDDYSVHEKVYQIILRSPLYKNGKATQIEMILMTIADVDVYTHTNDNEAMKILKTSIDNSLRRLDFEVQYSNKQYVVMLIGTNSIIGDTVAERILKSYDALCGNEYSEVVYTTQTIKLNTKKSF